MSHLAKYLSAPVSQPYNHEFCSSYTQIRRYTAFCVQFKIQIVFRYICTVRYSQLYCKMKCALVTRKAQGTIKQFYNSKRSQKCCSLVYPFKNILYNHLTGNVGKQHIGKGWNKAEISELVQGKTFLLPKDPFENIKAILI